VINIGFIIRGPFLFGLLALAAIAKAGLRGVASGVGAWVTISLAGDAMARLYGSR
jgi:hypothetical protein